MPEILKAQVPHRDLFMLCTDVIEREDGSYSAQPMRLPTVNGDSYHQFVENYMSNVVYKCFGRKEGSILVPPL
jgi:hypothetical protein